MSTPNDPSNVTQRTRPTTRTVRTPAVRTPATRTSATNVSTESTSKSTPAARTPAARTPVINIPLATQQQIEDASKETATPRVSSVRTPARRSTRTPIATRPEQKIAPVVETVSKVLGGLNLFTEEQIERLRELKLESGETMLTLGEKWFIYEIIGLIKRYGYEESMEYLTGNKWGTRKDVIFNAPTLANAKNKVLNDAEIFRRKGEAVAGLFKCRKCGSNETISVDVQTRSADEPMTTKVTCVACGNKWVA